MQLFLRMYPYVPTPGETLKSLLALQVVTQGGITQVDKCLCKFMTRTLPELNSPRLALYLWLLMMFLGVPVVDPYPIWQCTVQQKHGSCHQDYTVFSFLAHIMDCMEISVNSWERLAYGSGGGRMGARQNKPLAWVGEARCSLKEQGYGLLWKLKA